MSGLDLSQTILTLSKFYDGVVSLLLGSPKFLCILHKIFHWRVTEREGRKEKKEKKKVKTSYVCYFVSYMKSNSVD